MLHECKDIFNIDWSRKKNTNTLSTDGVVFLTFIRLRYFNVYNDFQYTS